MFNLTQRWRFPSNNYGATLGISESGVEMFNGTPIKSLAREICQNSLDACLDAGKPTRVEFKTFEVIPQEIPGHEALVDACRRAHAYWEVQSDKKAQKFFQKALHTLCAERIACLRISDFNTTGLRGSRRFGTRRARRRRARAFMEMKRIRRRPVNLAWNAAMRGGAGTAVRIFSSSDSCRTTSGMRR